ncbi:MAG: radical SAM family heme chaperone HemW [Chloroflexota bacterium]|nr:radical SAM family heme chaperone HemW [Chloroflexota bacterium]
MHNFPSNENTGSIDRGLYVHIPFCVRKCAYCDFYSLSDRSDLVGPYIDAVLDEGAAYGGMSFHTLYIGGGTPSVIGSANLKKLIDGLRRCFDLSSVVEATIETNPESAIDELLSAALESGFGRISIGVQSLSDSELRSVGRVHIAEQAAEALTRARRAGFKSISADLIVGLPGQSRESLRGSIEGLIDTGVDHLSLYCLSLEPGTPLAAEPPRDLPTDDEQAELFDAARSLLIESGFIHYEISNFAVEGHGCLHNLNYWRGGEYLGLGPAAASHLDGKRFKNRADLDAYLHDPNDILDEIEELSPIDKSAEEAMLRLRLLREGIDVVSFTKRYGLKNVYELLYRLEKLMGEGLLVFDGTSYRLEPSQVLVSNPILARVLSD